MDDLCRKARSILSEWKGESYVFGRGVIGRAGALAARYGRSALVVSNSTYLKPVADAVLASLAAAGVDTFDGMIAPDAGPNAPREDVYRLACYALKYRPDCIVAIGGGSTIDACKAASVLASAGSPELERFFGTGLVAKALAEARGKLVPVLAVQVSASSGAHLTKYANITDPAAGQKKLIVDEAIIPPTALFDYEVTASMPRSVTIDGALDAIAHVSEVLYGLPPEKYELGSYIARVAIELVAIYAPRVVSDPRDMEAREAIGLATDLGGYAIMIGGTSGAHLTSFSLVDIVSHGTACGVMNPYYMVYYAPKIEGPLRLIGDIMKWHGYVKEDLGRLSGRDLGIAVARGLVAFSRSIGAPATLGEIAGFTEAHVARALAAAKNPQLEMKLKNMPVPMAASEVDAYMGPILRAAVGGDFSLIRNKG
jgi:Alcohol dehydrogenase, class IV